MKIIEGGVTAAKGFEAAGIAAEIKYKGRSDMAMVYSQKPCQAAGAFTTNVVKAAPVKWDQKIVKESAYAQAVVVNSGIANACTGEEGYGYCKETANKVSDVLGIPADAVLVGSTGVIGMQLPIERIKTGVEKLAMAKCDSIEAGTEAAKAIMTTDTCKKEIAVELTIDGKTVTIGGMAKGSGMIHPNMCTMLSFITTDAAISKSALQKALSADVEDTYNMISVDGDTSTNDTVLVLANGMAGNDEIISDGEAFESFMKALNTVTVHLCRMIAGDGEGATKLLECIVSGADSEETAVTVSKSVICSSLFKAAMFGADANWGRVLCAIGYSGADVDVTKIDVSFKSSAGTIEVCKNGAGIDFSEEIAKEILIQDEIQVLINLNSGDVSATAWGCDLTYDYVKINGDYRT